MNNNTLSISKASVLTAEALGRTVRGMDKARTRADNLFLEFVKTDLLPIASGEQAIGPIIELTRQFFSSAFPNGVNQAWIADLKNATRQGLDTLSKLTGGSFTFRQGSKDKTSSSYRPFISWAEPKKVDDEPEKTEQTEPEKTEPEKTEQAEQAEPEKAEQAEPEKAEPAPIAMGDVVAWIVGCTDEELTNIRSTVLAEMKRRADQIRAKQREIAKAVKKDAQTPETLAA